MNRLTSQQRKWVYFAGMILLLIPVILLGRLSAPAPRGQATGDPGGVLAQLRTANDLGESSLGNVDPSSATMNLVLLGLRGPAATLLWLELDRQKDMKNWAEMKALTESIILLQPHFQKVWVFHGWNLAYNVSAEWDAVKDRYFWVKEGAKFYKRGTQRLFKFPELYWYTGDTLGKKIGRSDEWKQFRRFFRQDPLLPAINGELGPDPEINAENKDNYEVAAIWFQEANDVMDRYRKEQHIQDITLFRSYPGRALFDYAGARQREGLFDEVTRLAWERGFEFWTKKYGQEQYPSPGGVLHLEWTAEEIARDAKSKSEEYDLRTWVGKYQDMTNYRYWRTRALAEREQNTLEAHRDLFQGLQALGQGESESAEKLSFSGLQKFQAMLEKFPPLANDDLTVEEVLLGQVTWRAALQINAGSVPEEFPLKGMWVAHQARIPDIQKQFERRLTPERD